MAEKILRHFPTPSRRKHTFDHWIASSAPPWIEALIMELFCQICGIKSLKGGKKPSAPDLARILATGRTIAAFLRGRTKVSPEITRQLRETKRFEREIKRVLKKYGMKLPKQTGLASKLPWEKADVEAMKLSATASLSEGAAFSSACGESLKRTPDDLFGPTAIGNREKMLFLMLIKWRWVESQPSIGAVYRAFEKANGKEAMMEFESFRYLCRKIGLRLKARGRPKKGKS